MEGEGSTLFVLLTAIQKGKRCFIPPWMRRAAARMLLQAQRQPALCLPDVAVLCPDGTVVLTPAPAAPSSAASPCAGTLGVLACVHGVWYAAALLAITQRGDSGKRHQLFFPH